MVPAFLLLSNKQNSVIIIKVLIYYRDLLFSIHSIVSSIKKSYFMQSEMLIQTKPDCTYSTKRNSIHSGNTHRQNASHTDCGPVAHRP